MKPGRFIGLMLLLAVLASACSAGGANPDPAQESQIEVVAESADTMAQESDTSTEMVGEDDHGDDMDTMEEAADGDAMMDEHGSADDTTMEELDSGDSALEEESQGDAMTEDDHSAEDMDSMEDDSSADDMMEDDASTEETMEEEMALPDWFSAELVDVNTGETFTVKDLKGKVVLVETLAVWCSNCLRQQGQVKELHSLLGDRDDFVSVGIDIDLNESPAVLSDHTARHGFDWLYAVAPRDVAREIGQLYGDQFLNPPSTPMLIVDRHGGVHLLPFGIKSAQDLMAALEPFLNEGM